MSSRRRRTSLVSIARCRPLSLVRRSLWRNVGKTYCKPMTILLLRDIRSQCGTSGTHRGHLHRRHLYDRDFRCEKSNLFNSEFSLAISGRGGVDSSKIFANRGFAFVPFTPDIDMIDVLCIDRYHGVRIVCVPTVVKLRLGAMIAAASPV